MQATHFAEEGRLGLRLSGPWGASKQRIQGLRGRHPGQAPPPLSRHAVACPSTLPTRLPCPAAPRDAGPRPLRPGIHLGGSLLGGALLEARLNAQGGAESHGVSLVAVGMLRCVQGLAEGRSECRVPGLAGQGARDLVTLRMPPKRVWASAAPAAAVSQAGSAAGPAARRGRTPARRGEHPVRLCLDARQAAPLAQTRPPPTQIHTPRWSWMVAVLRGHRRPLQEVRNRGVVTLSRTVRCKHTPPWRDDLARNSMLHHGLQRSPNMGPGIGGLQDGCREARGVKGLKGRAELYPPAGPVAPVHPSNSEGKRLFTAEQQRWPHVAAPD